MAASGGLWRSIGGIWACFVVVADGGKPRESEGHFQHSRVANRVFSAADKRGINNLRRFSFPLFPLLAFSVSIFL
jgi:hypothetical protein